MLCLRLVAQRQLFQFFPQHVKHLFLAVLVALHAARLHVQVVDRPVREIVAERQHTPGLVNHVQLAGTMEVNDGAERARVTIEEELWHWRRQVKVVADGRQLSAAATCDQSTKSSAWQARQRSPRHLVTNTANVDNDASTGQQIDDL